jgi:hypothetical protein
MKTYRILADYSTLYEIYIEADSPEEALEQAQEASISDFSKFDPRGQDDFNILPDSIEELTE